MSGVDLTRDVKARWSKGELQRFTTVDEEEMSAAQ